MSLCLLAGAKVTTIALATFTLSWTHSIEKSRWEEDWRVTPQGLVLEQARIESMGAGMEPPPGAKFDGKFWRWKPALGALPEVNLRRSDSQPQGWALCANGQCRTIGGKDETADIVTLKACD